jgi:hypothetical protein
MATLILFSLFSLDVFSNGNADYLTGFQIAFGQADFHQFGQGFFVNENTESLHVCFYTLNVLPMSSGILSRFLLLNDYSIRCTNNDNVVFVIVGKELDASDLI